MENLQATVSIQLTPEQVQAEVIRAVIESNFGQELLKYAREKVQEMLKDKYSYNNVVKNHVEYIVKAQIGNIVNTEFKTQIEEQVKAGLTADMVKEAVDKVMTRVFKDY